MKMETDIKVLTLNCWGIIGISKHRKLRISAIASHLASSDYDFVFLQEVWSEADYNLICRKAEITLPYSHYFYSGVMGSGVCIFSKSQIVDIAMHQYSLNGYAHKIHHGDWFGGKVVGLCKVLHKGLRINLYTTHLHAEYNTRHDQYLPHRVAQAFEFSQFVRLTSDNSDISIIGGDFNTEPSDIAYRIITHNTGSSDAYVEQLNLDVPKDGVIGSTCGHPRNSYTSRKCLVDNPEGQRIDYIFYKTSPGTAVKCYTCTLPLDKIPNTCTSYSDHEAVTARLHIIKSMEYPLFFKNQLQRSEALQEGHQIIIASLTALWADKLFYLLMACLITCLLFITFPFSVPIGFNILLIFVRVVLSIILGFSLWMGTVMYRIERSALLNASKGIEVLLATLRQDISESSGMFTNCEGSSDNNRHN